MNYALIASMSVYVLRNERFSTVVSSNGRGQTLLQMFQDFNERMIGRTPGWT